MDIARFLQNQVLWLAPLGLALAFYLGLPALIKLTQKFRRDFTIDQIDLSEMTLPGDVARFFDQSAEQLDKLGFQGSQVFLMADLIPNTAAVFAVFENRAHDEAAITVVMYGFQGPAQQVALVQEEYVEFSTDFSDGTSVSTNNNRQESVFKPVPRRRVAQLPGEQDIDILLKVHRYLVSQSSKQPKRALPDSSEWAETLRGDVGRELAEQLDTGYLTIDASQQYYLMSWVGAYCMVWKKLWPISWLRLRARKSDAKRLRIETGCELR